MIRCTCRHCGLGGDMCFLRFSRGHPTYHYEKRRMGEGITDACWGVTPAPRYIANPDKETCPEWRDCCGRSKEVVQKLLDAGTYSY